MEFYLFILYSSKQCSCTTPYQLEMAQVHQILVVDRTNRSKIRYLILERFQPSKNKAGTMSCCPINAIYFSSELHTHSRSKFP